MSSSFHVHLDGCLVCLDSLCLFGWLGVSTTGLILPLLNVTIIGDSKTHFRWWDAVFATPEHPQAPKVITAPDGTQHTVVSMFVSTVGTPLNSSEQQRRSEIRDQRCAKPCRDC